MAARRAPRRRAAARHALAAAALTVLAGWQLRRFGADNLEYDFSHLRRRDTWVSGEGFWGKKMDTLMGRYLTPTALLTDSVAEARAVATQAARGRRPSPPLAGDDRVDPHLRRSAAPDQDAKADELEAIRRKRRPSCARTCRPTTRADLDDSARRRAAARP